MHASLASIGRACTVEDEEPPGTPPHSSLDSQSGATREPFARRPPGGWCLRELVDCAYPLTKSIRFLPYFDKAVYEEQQSCFIESPGCFLPERAQPLDDAETTEGSGDTSFNRYLRLDQLVRLHRVCTLTRCSFEWNSLADTYNEIVSGPMTLFNHSAGLACTQYETLETCVSDFAQIPVSPYSVFRDTCFASGTLDPRLSSRSSRVHSFIPPRTAFHNSTTGSHTTHLGELRVICENLRQCLTQVRRFAHEQCTLVCHVEHLAGSTCHNYGTLIGPAQVLSRQTDLFASLSLVSAHHIMHGGLSMLAHFDLTRFIHGELWEMMRGMEELDILSKHLRTLSRSSYATSLQRHLCKSLVQPNSVTYLYRIMHLNILCDPLCTLCPISIGYLFVLIAHQRSVRLAHAVFHQLSALSTYEQHKTEDNTTPLMATPSDEVKPRRTLVEAFREYLSEYRPASEYLRVEYEFIVSFLDVLSQSTSLLYQVQKLKLVCSAAAAAQTKVKDIYKDLQATVPLSAFTPTDTGSSRAVSVEGKHGILIRRTSGDSKFMDTLQSNPRTAPTKLRENVMNQYQDTLQRACTLDRYVATGSILSPLCATDSVRPEDVPDQMTPSFPSVTAAEAPTCPLPTPAKTSTKKAVQWSDHREISTRHQVIGRFLEMVWRYTETMLHTLFLFPPLSAVVFIQARDLSTSSQSTSKAASFNTITGDGGLCECLCMSTKHLRKLAGHIRDLAKSDIFPIGLIPVLKRQALRLDEIAHRRCCYAETHRLLPRRPVEVQSTPVNMSSVNNCVVCASANKSCSHSLLMDQWSHDDAKCAVSLLDRFRQHSCSPQHHTMFATAHYQLDSYLNSALVHLDLQSLLLLLVKCVNHLAGDDMSHGEHLLTFLDQRLKAIGVPVNIEHKLLSGGSNQPGAVIQSLYEICRRVLTVSTRFFLLLFAFHKFTVRDCMVGMMQVQLATNPIAPFQTLCSHILSAIHLSIIHTTHVAQLVSLTNLFRFLLNSLRTAVLCGLFRTDSASQDDIAQPGCSIPVTPSDLHSAYHSVISARPRWGLCNGVRIAKLAACLATVERHVNGFLVHLEESDVQIRDRFTAVCSQLIHISWMDSLKRLSNRPLSAEQLGQFVDTLIQTQSTCVAMDSQIGDASTRVTSCRLHTHIYEQTIGAVFDLFCQHWCEVIVQSTPMESRNTLRDTILHHHTTSVQRLRDILLLRQCSIPVHLLAVMCECERFQALQSFTLSPYDGLGWRDASSTHCLAPASTTFETSSEANTATAAAPRIGRSPFGGGEALVAALTAGVRSGLVIPLKNLVRSQNSTITTVTASDPLIPVALSTPTTSHDSSSDKS